MLYFKNVDLADSYHVSLRTVLNWIEAAKQGKLDLALHDKNGKTYVANTARNVANIEKLVADRKKYRNSRGLKVITPQERFYKLYDKQQILDIISNLDVYHEIPRQYNYFDGGADYWDKYARRLVSEEAPNLLTSTRRLLEINKSYLNDLLAKYKRVNVFDIGVGNALPVQGLLRHLLDRKVLGRYVALDISARMLEIARENIKDWFDDQISFEGYALDINYDRFSNLLADEYLGKNSKDTLNLVLLFGGTLSNLRKPDSALKIIHDSMGLNDLLLYSDKLDTEASRRYFDFNPKPGSSTLAPNHRFIFDLLNIDESLYDVEMGFREQQRQRYIQVRLKVALTVKFNFEEGERVIEFSKGESILLWRSWEVSALDVVHQFDRNDFHMLHESQTEDQEYILTVSRVRGE